MITRHFLPFVSAALLCSSAARAQSATVLVHVDGADDVRLEKSTEGDWQTMCTGTCDKRLPADAWYRVSGRGMKTSDSFDLHPGERARETLHVDRASKGWFLFGEVTTGIGATVAILGLLTAAGGWITRTAGDASSSGDASKTGSVLTSAGWSAAAGGGVLVLVGIFPLLSNWSTTVSQEADGAP